MFYARAGGVSGSARGAFATACMPRVTLYQSAVPRDAAAYAVYDAYGEYACRAGGSPNAIA